MQTITTQVNVFSFNELSDEIKMNVINQWRNDDQYFFDRDNSNSLDAFCNLFKINVKDYEYGYRNYISASFNLDSEVIELDYLKLHKHLVNNYWHKLHYPKSYYKAYKKRSSKIQSINDCVLTGYYIDNELLQPIYDFLKKPYKTDFKSLLNDCLNNWLSACQKDYDYWNSAECIIEEIECNDYQFLDNGNIYNY